MHCTCRDNQDVDQPMIDLAGTLWILERGKVLDRLFYRHCHSPLIDEGRAGMAHQTVRSRRPVSCVLPAAFRAVHSAFGPGSSLRITAALLLHVPEMLKR